MKEALRTNDLALLSYAAAVLAEQGIESAQFDQHASLIEGSIGAIQRRLMVLDEDWERAREILRDAGIEPAGP